MAKGKFQPRTGPTTQLHDIPGDDDSLPDRVNLDAKDPNEFQIVEVDDTPAADRGGDTEWTGDSLADQEDDLRNYSTNAQKRIKRLSAETHKNRRAREAAERELGVAAQRIQSQEAELQRLRLTTESGNNALLGSMRADRENRITDATRRLERCVFGDAKPTCRRTPKATARRWPRPPAI